MLQRGHTVGIVIYIAFAFGLAIACYLQPVRDDFDRYAYEAVVRSQYQSIEQVYIIVKHESPRAEMSSVMDSPAHLAQLEPLYAIRPLYIGVIGLMTRITASPQKAINLVSAVSLFACALVMAIATRRYLYSALLMLVPSVLLVGRIGTPDALSALIIVSSHAMILRSRLLPAIILLMLSVWVRTDNVLLVFAMLSWLVMERRLRPGSGFMLILVGLLSVLWINSEAGNYGWQVLFQYSFIGGKYPAEIVAHFGLAEYLRVVLGNFKFLAPQVAPWLLLGFITWNLKSDDRPALAPVFLACCAHYALYPSPEGRYLTWAYLVVGLLFIRAMTALETETALKAMESAHYGPSPRVA